MGILDRFRRGRKPESARGAGPPKPENKELLDRRKFAEKLVSGRAALKRFNLERREELEIIDFVRRQCVDIANNRIEMDGGKRLAINGTVDFILKKHPEVEVSREAESELRTEIGKYFDSVLWRVIGRGKSVRYISRDMPSLSTKERGWAKREIAEEDDEERWLAEERARRKLEASTPRDAEPPPSGPPPIRRTEPPKGGVQEAAGGRGDTGGGGTARTGEGGTPQSHDFYKKYQDVKHHIESHGFQTNFVPQKAAEDAYVATWKAKEITEYLQALWSATIGKSVK